MQAAIPCCWRGFSFLTGFSSLWRYSFLTPRSDAVDCGGGLALIPALSTWRLLQFFWIFLPDKHLVSFKKRGNTQALNPRKHFPPHVALNSYPCLPDLSCKGVNKLLKALRLGKESYNPFDLHRETEARAGKIPYLSQQRSTMWGSISPHSKTLFWEQFAHLCVMCIPLYDCIITQSLLHGSLTAAVYCPLETGWQQPTAPPQQLTKVSQEKNYAHQKQ